MRSRLEADAAEIPHRALRRAFLRLVGYTLARCRQGRPDVPALTLRALVGTPRWCATAIDRAVLLGWLRIEREADRLEHRCRRFAPGPQAGAPAPDPVPGCIIEFPMQHRSIVEFPMQHMRFLGTHNDPKGDSLTGVLPTRAPRAAGEAILTGDNMVAGRRAPPEQLPRPPTREPYRRVKGAAGRVLAVELPGMRKLAALARVRRAAHSVEERLMSPTRERGSHRG